MAENTKSDSGSSGGWGNILSMIFSAGKNKQEQNNAKKMNSSNLDSDSGNKFSTYKSGWGGW